MAPDFELFGNTYEYKTKEAFSFSQLMIDFTLCGQKDQDCMSSEEIDNYLLTYPEHKKRIIIHRLSNQLDYEDIEDPIKTSLARVARIVLDRDI